MPRPRIPLGFGPFDQQDLEVGGGPKDECDGGFRVTVNRLGVTPVLRPAGEPVLDSTQTSVWRASVWDLHSDTPGVGLPDMFVKLGLKSDRKTVFENPAGQIEEIAGVPNG